MLFLRFKKLSIYTYQLASYVDNVLLMGLSTDPPPPYYLPHVRAPPHSAMYQSVSRQPAWRVTVWGLIVKWSIEGHTDHDECTVVSREQQVLLGPSYNRIIWQRTIKHYSVWHALGWCKFSVLRRLSCLGTQTYLKHGGMAGNGGRGQSLITINVQLGNMLLFPFRCIRHT